MYPSSAVVHEKSDFKPAKFLCNRYQSSTLRFQDTLALQLLSFCMKMYVSLIQSYLHLYPIGCLYSDSFYALAQYYTCNLSYRDRCIFFVIWSNVLPQSLSGRIRMKISIMILHLLEPNADHLTSINCFLYSMQSQRLYCYDFHIEVAVTEVKQTSTPSVSCFCCSPYWSRSVD